MTIILPKKGDMTDIENYRLISLLTYIIIKTVHTDITKNKLNRLVVHQDNRLAVFIKSFN